jgi:hypothetical protein
MADAVNAADHVIPRSILGIVLDAGLLAQPPIEGVVTAVAGSAAKVLWSTGELVTGLDVTNATVSPLLRVAAPTDTSLMGQVVQLTGKNPEFSGPVVQVLGIELDPAGAAGTFTDCVVVKSRGPSQAYFVATVANVVAVD